MFLKYYGKYINTLIRKHLQKIGCNSETLETIAIKRCKTEK